MPFPTTAFGAAAVIVLLVPGLVYGVVRRSQRGFRHDDLALEARIAQALVVSVALDAVYFIAASSWVNGLVRINGNGVQIADPLLLGVAVLVAAILIPAGLAAIVHMPYRLRRQQAHQGRRGELKLERTAYYEPVPTAWDWGASKPQRRMVRVTLPDSRYYGGLYGPGSYVSTYPEPRDIYISHQYHMNEDGSFGAPAMNAAGLWLRIGDDYVVEFFEPSYTEEEAKEIENG